MSQFIRLESDGPVRHLVLDAPERRNALNRQMLGQIAAAVAAVAADRQARALLVSGEGKAFCAGADLAELFGDPGWTTAELRDDLKQTYASFLGISNLTIPTIAAVNGVAVGAGVNIACACDILVAGPRARFALTFAEIGLHPGGGASWFLTRRMGADRALLALLSAEHIGAEEAYRLGLATMLTDDPVAKALELAHLFAGRDPQLVRDVKRTVQLSVSGALGDVVELESWAQAASVGQPRFQKFLADFSKKAVPPLPGPAADHQPASTTKEPTCPAD